MKPTRSSLIALTSLLLAALLGAASPLIPAGASPSPAFSEDFAGGTFPPASWVDTDGVWSRSISCAGIDGSACATISTTAPGRHDLRLRPVDTTHLTNPVLKFDLFVSEPNPGIAVSVLSYDSGGMDGLGSPPHMPGGAQGKQTISVPLGSASNFGVAIGFNQTGTGGYVQVDNVTVTGDLIPNSPPVATANTVQVNEDGTVPITLQGHDTDGGNVTFAIATPPAHGTLSGTAPNVNYQPAQDWNGTDTFTFVTNDGADDSAPATVTIDVLSINDAPVLAGPAAVTTTPGTPVFFQSAFNNALSFVDPDAGLATVAAYVVSTGTVTLSKTTGLTFTTGDGSADTQMNFTGTLPAINAALDGMWVAAPPGGGNFNLTLGMDDGGASGGGIARQVERTVPITVSSAATYAVDALVASQGIEFAGATGDGVLVGPTAAVPDSQRVTLPTADPWSFQKAQVWVQNDGNQLERFKLSATAGDSDVDVAYFFGGSDLTSAIKAGNASTLSLSPGQAARIEVQFRVAQHPKNTATRTYKLTATSEHNTASTDSVEFVLPLLGVAQPDLWVKSNQLDDPFEAAPKNQAKGATVVTATGTDPTLMSAVQINGAPSTFEIGLDNLAATDGRVMVRSAMSMIGFDYRLFLLDANGARTDVTTVSGSGVGLAVELGSKVKKRLVAEVFTVPSSFFQGPVANLTITAGALGNDQTDQVIIRTVQMKPGVDLAIAGPGDTTAGGIGKLNPSDLTQVRSAAVATGDGAEFRIDARNGSDVSIPNYPERVAWTTSGAPAGWTVDYFAGTTNVTAAMVAGTYLSDVAAKGIGSADPVASLRVVIKPGTTVRPGDVATVKLTGRSTRSTATPPPSDSVTAEVRLGYSVDALVGPAGGPFLGDGVVNTTGAGQTSTQTVKIGTDGIRTVRIRNSGAIGDRYKLTIPTADITGPGAVVSVTTGNQKILDAVQNAGAMFDLAPGSTADVTVTVRPDGQMGPGSTRDVTLTVSSVNHPTVRPDVVKISTVIGQIDCAPQSVAFDNIKLSGDCILTTDLGYVSSQPMNVNGLRFTFPSGSSGIVYRSQAWVIPKYATQYIPWFRSTNTVMSFKDATLFAGPLDMRMGGGGSTTLAAIGAKGSLNGLSIEPGAKLLVAFPPDKPGKVSLELPLLPPPLFAQRNSAPQVVTSDADGGAQVPLTMSWPQLTYSTIGMVDFKATYDPATDSWTGFGRMGFPGGLYFPAITAVMKFTGSSGGYQLTYLFGRLSFGSAEPQVAPLITLKSLEALYDKANGVFYGKAAFNALPIASALNAEPGSKLASLPGTVFGLDGKFAYLDGPQTLTLNGTVSLLGLFNLGGASFTAGPGGMRASGNLNYTIDLGPLGVAGLRASVDGGISYSSGFQIEGTGSVVIGGADVGSMKLLMSNKGAAGCGSVFGAAAGFGFSWGGSPSIFGSCDLSPWQVDNIPAHADFSAIQGQISATLNKVDDVQRLMSQLPGAVKGQLGI